MTYNDHSVAFIAFGILLSAWFMLSLANCASGDDETTESSPKFQRDESRNCADKHNSARPACWKAADWQAYCSNTGNCRR